MIEARSNFVPPKMPEGWRWVRNDWNATTGVMWALITDAPEGEGVVGHAAQWVPVEQFYETREVGEWQRVL